MAHKICDLAGGAAIAANNPRWARFILIVLPTIVVYTELVGLLLDGCLTSLFVSDTMDDDHCIREVQTEEHPVEARASAYLNRLLIWHYFFLMEVLKRVVYLPPSITRNVFVVIYPVSGLLALYCRPHYYPVFHVIFGLNYMVTGCFEIPVLWYPLCGPPLGPCCPACCYCLCRRPLHPDETCSRRRRTAILITVYIAVLSITFGFTFALPAFGIPWIVFGPQPGIRIDAVLEWTLVTAFQVIHWCRAPTLAAAKYPRSLAVMPSAAERPRAAAELPAAGRSEHSAGVEAPL